MPPGPRPSRAKQAEASKHNDAWLDVSVSANGTVRVAIDGQEAWSKEGERKGPTRLRAQGPGGKGLPASSDQILSI